MMELIKARCYYLAENSSIIILSAVWMVLILIYDTEEGHIYYESKNDYEWRARACRYGGILMTKYLQQKEDVHLEESPKKYITLCGEGTLEKETGRVFNDYQRDDSYKAFV